MRIPWFATQFGRDANHGAADVWLDPQIAAGVLALCASTQARETDAFPRCRARQDSPRDAPRRDGGAARGTFPAIRRGGYDAALYHARWRASGRPATRSWSISSGQPAPPPAGSERRLTRARRGSWTIHAVRVPGSSKPGMEGRSQLDVSHRTAPAFPKVRSQSSEVQGYACATEFIAMAELAEARCVDDRAHWMNWRTRAEQLRSAITSVSGIRPWAFMRLRFDGHGAPCKVRGSKPGHLPLLWHPERRPQRGAQVAEQLMSERFHGGWGIPHTPLKASRVSTPCRTTTAPVWPHDTALCGAGITRCSAEIIVELLSEMNEAASLFAMRLPELWCGFTRVPGQGSGALPVACFSRLGGGLVSVLLQRVQHGGERAQPQKCTSSDRCCPVGVRGAEPSRTARGRSPGGHRFSTCRM